MPTSHFYQRLFCVQVSEREARAFASEHGLPYTETSAKNGHNIEQAFKSMASKIYDALESGDIKPRDGWDGVKVGGNCYIQQR